MTVKQRQRWVFYGWVILAIAVIAQILTAPGQTVGVSEFKDLFADRMDIDDRTIAVYYCYGTALGSFALPLFGYLIDRLGCRYALMIVSLLFAVTCFLSGYADSLWELLLVFTFLRMLGQGALSLVASTMVSLWFKRKLAIAYTIMSIGTGLGMMFVPYLFKPLFMNFDLIVAFKLLAFAVFVLVPISIFLVVDRPQKMGYSQDGDLLETSQSVQNDENATQQLIATGDFTFWQAISTRSFWIVTAAQSAWALIGTGLVFNRKAIFTALESSEFLIDLAIPGLFAAVIAGQLITGLIARRFSHASLFCLGSFGMASACGLILWGSPLSAFSGFVVFGFAQGVFIIMGQSLWADFYGRSHIGKIRGLVWMIVVMASSLGGFALTLGSDPVTQFNPIRYSLVVMICLGGACLFIDKPDKPNSMAGR